MIYLNLDFHFMMTTVSSDGLDDQWLGKLISKSDVENIGIHLSEKFGFNLNFEGGEAETFVIDCPSIFLIQLKLINSQKIGMVIEEGLK